MESPVQDALAPANVEHPAAVYRHYRYLFRTPASDVPTGLLFDNQGCAITSVTHPPDTHTPDLDADKDGDRVLVLLEGDFALQIGESRFRMRPGDAVEIPRGVSFGRSHSHAGAHLLLIRSKALRSFSLHR